MKEPISIPCRVISPMFSYGNGLLEPRATEIKGLLRNTYRIANPDLDLKTLYQYETMLFGGHSLDKSGEIAMKASPLRIQMYEQKLKSDTDKQLLRLHVKERVSYDENNKQQVNYGQPCFRRGKLFEIILSITSECDDFSSIPHLKNEDPVRWYTELFHLMLVLCGIGKRSRRGRGCMTADKLLQIPESELPKWVAAHLNEVCGTRAYTESGNRVSMLESFGSAHDRPFIKEIRFGKLQNAADVNEYLKKVDKASHEIKGDFRWPNATGFARGQSRFARGQSRFASSVIVSLTEIRDGVVPVYTLLNPVCNGNQLGNTIKFYKPFEEQNDFIKRIEAGDYS